MRTTYDKLIRDRIPEIMDREGVRYEIGTLASDAFRKALLDKVVEEARELSETAAREDIVKEVADLYEVVDALLALDDIDSGEVRAMQATRRRERGAFERRLILRWTER